MLGDFFLKIYAWFLYFWMTVIHDFVKFVNQFGDYLDTSLMKTKPYIFDVARICVLSTFIEDGFQKLVNWDAEREFMEEKWNCGWHLATLFVLFTILGQLIPTIMILSKNYVRASCGILASILVLQNVTHYIPWSWSFLIANMAVGCSLWILFAVIQYEQRSMNIHAADRSRNFLNQLQLNGILLRGGFFLHSMYLIVNYYYFAIYIYYFKRWSMLLIYFISLTLQSLKNFGYKPRIWGTVIALWFFGINLWCNSWWTNDDFMKFSFFQNTSLIGGLLLIVAYTPHGDGICLEDLRRLE